MSCCDWEGEPTPADLSSRGRERRRGIREEADALDRTGCERYAKTTMLEQATLMTR